MTTLRAILFDLGDTLLDFEPLDTRAVFRVSAQTAYDYLRMHGYALPPFARYCRRLYASVRWHYLWAKLRGREFNSMDLLRRMVVCWENGQTEPADLLELSWLWYAPLTQHTTVEAGCADMLARLRDQGLQLGIVSNTFIPGAVLDRHLAMHGLRDFFPVRVYSSEVGYRKPNSRIFQLALRQMGVEAEQAIFVGDLVKTDIVGASRAGMRTILKQPWGPAARSRADLVIRRLSELPEAIATLYRNRVWPAEVAAVQERHEEPEPAMERG